MIVSLWTPKIHVLYTHYIHAVQISPKGFTQSSINAKVKSHLNILYIDKGALPARINAEANFLSNWECVTKDQKLSASSVRWLNRPRIDVTIPKSRNRKETRAHWSRAIIIDFKDSEQSSVALGSDLWAHKGDSPTFSAMTSHLSRDAVVPSSEHHRWS